MEYASASHDALDKTLLPPSAFSAFAMTDKNKGRRVDHLHCSPSPPGPSVSHLRIEPIDALLSTLPPTSPLIAIPPLSSFARGVYRKIGTE